MKTFPKLFLLFFALAIFCFGGCGQQNSDPNIAMGNFQTGKYEEDWKKVNDFVQKGLPKSALEIVEEIYTKAKKENNPAQFVKAVIHKLKFQSQAQEDAFAQSIEQLQTELKQAKFPVKPVLHSMLAEMYFQYYQQNQYRFHDRTSVNNFNQTDFRTWDSKKFSEEIVKNYQASLEEPEKLQQLKIDIYDAILAEPKAENESQFEEDQKFRIRFHPGRNFRPTLYDFLAHRSIDFFLQQDPDLTLPATRFLMTDNTYFKPADEFAKLELKTSDELSYKFYALQTLQSVLRFHLKDQKPEALVDADMKRLAFIYQNAMYEQKEYDYRKALLDLEQKYEDQPVAAEVTYARAYHLYLESLKYNPNETQSIIPRNAVIGGKIVSLLPEEPQDHPNHFDAKAAFDICSGEIAESQKTIQRFPDTDAAKNCKALQDMIQMKDLKVTTEHINVPAKPFRILVKYRNLDNIFIKIVKITRDEIKNLKKENESPYDENYKARLIDFYGKKEAVQKLSVNLPEDGNDYQQHATEIKISELPLGEYIILTGTNENLDYNENAVAYDFISISNLSYIHRSQKDGKMEVYVLHRQTGQPLAGVKAQIWYNNYDYIKSVYTQVLGETFTTNQEGYFQIPLRDDNKNFAFTFSLQDDQLNTDDPENEHGNFYQSRPYVPLNESHYRTLFFMDRAIYRPGQTIYFKGMVIKTDGKKQNDISINTRVTVTLYDVNHQKVADLPLKTNEYGTFSGTFTAPAQSLNGEMSISASTEFDISSPSGTQFFSVEDYKRPKFEVELEKPKDTYRLNETVTLKGKAKSYSGANIDAAEVKYRVQRTARFPIWWFYSKGYYPVSPAMEIVNGVMKTNEKGEFDISFTAIPDPSVPKESKPAFNYSISADITDLNGETQSGSINVNVGYSALQLQLEIPEAVDKNTAQEFELKTTNLSDEFQTAKGTITIHKLKNPDTPFRERLWEKPDKFSITADDYRKIFPHDPVQDENDSLKWEKEAAVLTKAFDTEKEKVFKSEEMKNWKSGKYLIELKAIDRFGEEVKELKYFTLYAHGEKNIPYTTIDWFHFGKNKGEPGEKISLLAGTAAENLQALYEIEHDGQILSKEWLKFNKNEQKILEIPIKEEYRGNIAVHYTFIHDNRLYRRDEVITVPYTNKELDISFESFRNKLQPGEKEEWRLKIQGKNGDKVAAEMVAALYDASLDAFRSNDWFFDFYQNYYAMLSWESRNSFDISNAQLHFVNWNPKIISIITAYESLHWFGFLADFSLDRGLPLPSPPKGGIIDGSLLEETTAMPSNAKSYADSPRAVVESTGENLKVPKDATVEAGKYKSESVSGTTAGQKSAGIVKARTSFNETAFFYPHLQTNANGEIIISFTIPEALTRWKMLGFAHTKDLKYGLKKNELITQKELMVLANPPRFFREGDTIIFSAKLNNLSEKDLKGTAQLLLFNAVTMKPVDPELKNSNSLQTFELKKGQSSAVSWNLTIPENIDAVTYRVIAKADNFSDGEEMAIPVLSNRMLVTETLPLPIRGRQSRTFTLEKLLNNTSPTLRNHKLTLEYTSNPAWYAVQSLPYLMEYPYECAEQIFSRFYANSLASHVANSSPKIKQVFDHWKNITPDVFLSNLEKNQELKSLLLEETPWIRSAHNESEQKRRIALLFDLNTMSSELDRNLAKLISMQVSNGAWPWFQGMPEDRYITQHIVAGMGHLDHLGVKKIREDVKVWEMTKKAVFYIDKKIQEDYETLKKQKNIDMAKNHISYVHIHYLYARSYFQDIPVPAQSKEAAVYFQSQAAKYWVENNLYLQGMIALSLSRSNDNITPSGILKSLKEKAVFSEETGMYWQEEQGFYWHQAPIERQALMIELFDEVGKDAKAVDDLKVWLLKQKQVQNWRTTKSTAEAVYALLLHGSDWLAGDMLVEIVVGDKKIDPKSMDDVKVEAGTGYFKTSWSGDEIRKDMSKITVTKKDDGVAWGALYWQYFEQLDKITSQSAPLKVEKKLFLQKDSSRGPVIVPITEATGLKQGDTINVRIELRVDRDMEYVHMKDMRASGFEPVNVHSQYKYQDGLGYYETTRDAATNFFFSRLPKGTYVFEYLLKVSHKGNFSNGITTIQSMYAPEFSSHSEGIRVKVEGNG